MVLIKQDGFFDDIAAAFAAGDPHVGDKTIEAERVRCVQLMYHAIARGAFAEMLQLTADNFTLEIVGPENSKIVGYWQGHNEVLAAVGRNFSHFTEQSPQVETVVAQGDTVVVIAHEEGKLVATGRPYHARWVQVFTFENDRVAKVRQIFDGVEKFGAAELP